VNDKLECYTPCRVSYFWRSAENGKIEFSVKADGFKTWTNSITKKPTSFDKFDKVVLEVDYPTINMKETALIDFDKLMVEFKDGKLIGEKISSKGEVTPYKWKGSIKVG